MKFIIALILAIVMVVNISYSAFAQSEETSQPKDYFLQQFLGSTFGAAISALAVYAVRDFYCPLPEMSTYPCSSDNKVWISATLNVSPVGAVLGVNYVGHANHVQGNLFAAGVGAALGELGGGVVTYILAAFEYVVSVAGKRMCSGFGCTVLIFAPMIIGPGLGATIGYNIGATMKEPE